MKTIKIILLTAGALISGIMLRGCFVAVPDDTHSAASGPTLWTCSMHPEIRLPEPGLCPKCHMDLILLQTGNETLGEREISISPEAARLMELETTEVVRRVAAAEVRMVGKVDYDETRIATISARVPGRIERLYVDYTGIPVKKGEHLAEFYSPELLTAQQELLQAVDALANLKESRSELLRETAEQTVEAAREKLRLWGFTDDQIRGIEQRGTPGDRMTIYSPTAGIVIHRNATAGMYVQTGTPIYTVADLSTVWIKLDAYESDLALIRYGSKVEFTTEVWPGERFEGTISFVDPVIDPATRSAHVRLVINNAGGRLKPGMFVRATARPMISEDGRVINPDLSGKWISPMHPEVVKDEPGVCDVCGMPLVSAESLGYADENEAAAPLLIPVTAALKTGTRAVVYVEIPDAAAPTYEGRIVELGMRLGDSYVVRSGLREGERVVVHGSFKLDAEMQLQAKPGMMSMPSEDAQHAGRPQTHCPVMGGEISKDIYTDHDGMRIYFCCPGCIDEFQTDPGKFLEQMRAGGIEPEKTEDE
ncbi:MAG: efflux RND transporter periplasmic adaptor subunit [Pontiellaceae bacterium]|nr:efflux RND transporter periplasmic adaptor subunit [Pontiellaceae bacterium]MBN2783587.1 efflux RND transporter periplasmic adaptor subunit [Pontiellaceae bacterium]